MEIDYKDVTTQEMIENLLSLGEITVSFTKLDGTNRVMRCTLNESLIPVLDIPKNTNTIERKKNDNVRAVYDLDSNGWRSFRWDSVTSTSVT